MKKLSLAAGAAFLAGTAMVQAGGIDRSGQSVDIIFEEGTYAELSFGFVSPSVSGTDPFGTPTGDLAPSYTLLSGGYKTDFGDKFALALIVDQPFGAGAAYPGAGSVYDGITAVVNSAAYTMVGSYSVSDRIVVFGGAVAQSMSANAELGAYTIVADQGFGFGYVAGAAFQIPEYALRVSLTYRSPIAMQLDTLEFGAVTDVINFSTPQSVNLEFQTGINPKTLIFGSVRWVDWTEFSLSPANYPANPLLSYDNDVITYSLGVGRRLSDTLSAAVTLGYEASLGGAPSVLAPTDGYFSLGAGVTYSLGAAEITGGVRYVWIGDAADPGVGTFAGNNALAVGLKISYSM